MPREQAVSVEHELEPCIVIQVYRDPNGNWFASCRKYRNSYGRTPELSLHYSQTYTTPAEAINSLDLDE